MRRVPNLSISPEKVFFIVAKARRSDGEAAGFLASDAGDDMPEDHSEHTDRSELAGFIRGLNEDEQIDLVALMWLGRGDGTRDDWIDLRGEAERQHNNRTAAYLLGEPLLADHLEEGLSQFGFSCAEFEIDRL